MAALEVIGRVIPPTPDVLTLERPECDKKIKLRPGNWVARELRQYNDESIGHVVPASAYSRRSYKKYNSLYDVDFTTMNEREMKKYLQQRMVDELEQKKIEKARETVGDVFGGRKDYHTAEMFARWQIPTRFLDETDPVPTSTFDGLSSNHRPKAPTPTRLRSSTQKSKTKTMLPEINQQKSQRKSLVSQSLDRMPQEDLVIPSNNGMDMARPQTVDGPRTAASRTSKSPTKLRRSHTIVGTQPCGAMGKQASGQNLNQALQPEMRSKVDDWMQRAPNVNRNIIERLLKVAGKKTELEHAIKRTVIPDAQAEVHNWLKTATEQERKVALQFFTSVSDTGLMKHTENEKRLRLQEVINALDNGHGMEDAPEDKPREKPRKKVPSLRFLRMLTPQGGDPRWMKTTWHHLPEHKDDNRVENWSAMYTRAGAPKPRQYVIHPEWG